MSIKIWEDRIDAYQKDIAQLEGEVKIYSKLVVVREAQMAKMFNRIAELELAIEAIDKFCGISKASWDQLAALVGKDAAALLRFVMEIRRPQYERKEAQK